MNQRVFHSNIRILYNLDLPDLVQAGVIERGDVTAWVRFRENPCREYIHLSGARCDALWKLMEERGAK